MNDDKTDRLLDAARHAHDDQIYALTIAVSMLAHDGPVTPGVYLDNDELERWLDQMEEARRLARLYADPLRNLAVVDAIEILRDGLPEHVEATA